MKVNKYKTGIIIELNNRKELDKISNIKIDLHIPGERSPHEKDAQNIAYGNAKPERTPLPPMRRDQTDAGQIISEEHGISVTVNSVKATAKTRLL